MTRKPDDRIGTGWPDSWSRSDRIDIIRIQYYVIIYEFIISRFHGQPLLLCKTQPWMKQYSLLTSYRMCCLIGFAVREVVADFWKAAAARMATKCCDWRDVSIKSKGILSPMIAAPFRRLLGVVGKVGARIVICAASAVNVLVLGSGWRHKSLALSPEQRFMRWHEKKFALT